MPTWRKWRELLKIGGVCLLVAAIALHVVAVIGFVVQPTANDDFTPDAHKHMTAGEFANLRLGGKNGNVSLPISPDAPLQGQRPAVRLVDIVPGHPEPTVFMEMWASNELVYIHAPYSKVEWRHGDTGTITMTLENEKIEVLLVGSGYSYWRFITLRGAEKLIYIPRTSYDDYGFPHRDLQEVLAAYVTSFVITYPPNDPNWRKAVETRFR